MCPRMLRLKLTDGVSSFYAIEYEPINSLRLDTPPGTKILLTDPEFYNGRCLLRQGKIQVLGGVVSEMVALWKAQESLSYRNRFRSKVCKASGKPPKFISFEDFVKQKHRKAQPESTSISASTTKGSAGQIPAVKKVEDLDLTAIEDRRKKDLGDRSQASVKELGVWGSSKQLDKPVSDPSRRERPVVERREHRERRETPATQTLGDAGLSLSSKSVPSAAKPSVKIDSVCSAKVIDLSLSSDLDFYLQMDKTPLVVPAGNRLRSFLLGEEEAALFDGVRASMKGVSYRFGLVREGGRDVVVGASVGV
ncbi:uncharacterized protein [Blastocystis hominis]|uniref:RecQ-mediated genome instability protein 1 n=1 Tax=Blastocystis hominis TaxID=12968 RepID=D8M324_BLAHO|nr:uncharacterized protein [Blastocystis hominis]CBK22747.2 unnamed protein product [Blastocystis hominis]|eukprot:XP_012896795.1 uncharacterized protein [Blastocystis hominis]